MSTTFRRPKKPVRPRLIMIGDGEEDEDMDDEPSIENIVPQPPVTGGGGSSTSSVPSGNGSQSQSTSSGKSKEKPEKLASSASSTSESSKKGGTLLSFDDELDGDDGEVFKVKKSSVSRRLMKQRDREKKESKSSSKGNKEGGFSEEFQKTKFQIETFTEEIKITNSNTKKEKESPDVRILNGREAEAVDMESSDEEEDENVRFRRPTATSAIQEELRRVLQQGQIPDAKLIHEARKRKQMARQMGGAEFVPVENVARLREDKSRLVREDDNDQSEDEERIDFSTATNAARIDREKRREAFNAARDEERDRMSAGESDPEIEEWEKNQIRKAVSRNKMQNVAKEVYQQTTVMNDSNFMNNYQEGATGYEGFSFLPTSNQSSTSSNNIYQNVTRSEKDLSVSQRTNGIAKQLSPEMILQELTGRLEKLKLSRDRNAGELSRLTADLQLAEKELKDASESKPNLSSRFILYQNLRGYVTDLVPEIESLERRLLELMKARRDRLAERRRQDVKDQKEEVDTTLNILGGNPINVPPPSGGDLRSRRVAEREGRRTRRKTTREKSGLNKTHKDGLSSDDEETEFEISAYRSQRDAILHEASLIFEDVNEDFATISGVLERFEEWRDSDMDAYKESYAYMCVPKCLAPLIRVQLLSWDPLSDSFDMLKFPWIKPLISFGCHKKETFESLSTDPDSRLIPSVAEKIVLPFITRVIEVQWEPMSDRQTRSLVNVLYKIIDEWTAGASSKHMHSILTTVISKFKNAVDTDVFIPIFPKSVMSNVFSSASVYASRQFWSSVKLLDNMSKWQGLICDRPLQTLALDALLTRYILLGIRTAGDLSESSERAKGVVNVLPRAWFYKDGDHSPPPNGLLQLCRCLVSIVQSADCTIASNRMAIPEIAGILRTIGCSDEAQMILKKYS
ncbi:PAX3- and PAX7-binding protein 1 [Orchesella cincta]|uniref:PAX3-and PAX7-binding protein 1 n=1 Tax=Orchesella cincta TaxID=48709 RepID=A0A1D2NM96_ORCCI|nr:PAX3- and PAX7-binding protein 1 [Orchesella cincta]